MHPRQKLHWQHRNLVGCNLEYIETKAMDIARRIAKGGSLPGAYVDVLKMTQENGGVITSGRLSRDLYGAHDLVRDGWLVIQAKEALETLVVLRYLRRGRSKQKWKRPCYSTPQAFTFYRLTGKEF